MLSKLIYQIGLHSLELDMTPQVKIAIPISVVIHVNVRSADHPYRSSPRGNSIAPGIIIGTRYSGVAALTSLDLR